MGEVTLLIERAREGDRLAFDRLFQLLHPELRQVAHRRLVRNVRDGQLDTTALINECYLKLVQQDRLKPADRAHFLAYSASVMRSIIIDMARTALTDRRGGGVAQVTLNTEAIESVANPADEILDVHAALEALALVEPRLVRVVEMRYFAGMSDNEIAQALDITDRTVRRDWAKARLLLAHALRQ